MNMTAKIVEAATKTGRVARNPHHDFFLRSTPWAIQPYAIAPVLAGETMTNALLQARVVTDPIKAPLVGWWSEWYLFYVKLRDLDERDQITDMLMTPGYDASALMLDRGTGAPYLRYNDANTYHGGDHKGINWTRKCLDRIVAEYFRDEGDNPAMIGGGIPSSGAASADYPGLPPATIQTRQYWHDSVKLNSQMPVRDDQTVGEGFVETDQDVMPGFEAHYAQFQHMRALQMTTATFEDYLAQFGVKLPRADAEDKNAHRPELLRYVRDWQYPSNTVDPANGVPNAAVSWSIAERADKARFFAEPGFVVGVCVHRPKVYLGRQYRSAVSMLDAAMSWLPAVLKDDPYTSLRQFTPTTGPLGHTSVNKPSENYWVDVRDLFLYGDSMLNDYVETQTDANVMLSPKPNLERRYATDAEARALFKFADRTRVRMDGTLNLSVQGHQRDMT